MEKIYVGDYQKQLLVNSLNYFAEYILRSNDLNQPLDSRDVKLYRVREKECNKFNYSHIEAPLIEILIKNSGIEK